MHILKLICLTIYEFAKQAWSIPQAAVVAVTQTKAANRKEGL